MPKFIAATRLACTLSLWTAVLAFPFSAVAQNGMQSRQQTPQTAPQVEQVLPSYEGQNVTSVELAGQPDLNQAEYASMLAQQAGQPFSEAKINQSLATLQNLHRWNGVQIEIRPEAKGVRVLFVLQPAVYFGIYQFPGTDRFAYSRLLQVSDYPPRGAYTPVDVNNAEDALLVFLRRTGFFQAEIDPKLQTDYTNLVTNVIFNTHLGHQAKFGKVTITGTSPQQGSQLRGSIQSLWARLNGAAVRPGRKYNLKTLQNAATRLENQLAKHGHVAATAKLAGASYDPQTNRADIQFAVDPGPIVHVTVAGAHLWPWTRKHVIPLYQQAGVNPEIIQEGRQNLVSYFQSKGYFDAKVAVQVAQPDGAETVAYSVTKGPRHKVTGVHIAGNRHLSDETLMPHVTVQKGGFLSHGKFSDKLVHESMENLQNFYKANGYSDVQVTPRVISKSGNIDVAFMVKEGEQDIVQNLQVQGNNTVPAAQLLPKGFRARAGQPYSTKLVDEDRNHILARYLEMGYLNASFHATAAPAGKDKHKLNVVYLITEGPRVRTDQVLVLGARHTHPDLILRTAAIKTESPMRENEMLAAEDRLYSLDSVFDWAEIDPRRTITTQDQEDVLVKVHEAKRNEIRYGFGFQVVNRGGSIPSGTVAVPGIPPVGLPSNFKTSQKTFWGPEGTFQYTRRDFRGLGETLNLTGLANRLDQRGQFTYTDPHFRGTNWISDFTLSGEHNSQNPIFTSRQGEFGWQMQHPLNADKTQNIFLRYNFRETGLTQLLIPQLVPAQDLHVRLSTLSATYVRDTRDNPLDAHKGIYETGEVDVNPGFLGSNVSFARFLGQTAYYKKVWGGVVFANSIRLGLEQPLPNSHVPVSEKFFSGGGSTLRGFPLNGAGPQQNITVCGNPADVTTCAPIQVPTGGSELFILNSELRIPTPFTLPLINQKLGVVAFYDGGNVYPRIGFRDFAALYSNTLGAGLRIATPVGPIRIDIGHNLNAPPGVTATQFFVTLGQAF